MAKKFESTTKLTLKQKPNSSQVCVDYYKKFWT